MGTNNVYNTGIMHWRPGQVGKPACGTNRAIMAMDTADFEAWPRKCVKCDGKLKNARSRESTKKALCQPVGEIIARIESARVATCCDA